MITHSDGSYNKKSPFLVSKTEAFWSINCKYIFQPSVTSAAAELVVLMPVCCLQLATLDDGLCVIRSKSQVYGSFPQLHCVVRNSVMDLDNVPTRNHQSNI